MSASTGFQLDLNDLNSLYGTDIPYIEQTCTDVETTLKTNEQNDTTMFKVTIPPSGSGEEYLDLTDTMLSTWGGFDTTRSDLEQLLSTLSSSLADCALALQEIYRRYEATEDDISSKLGSIGSGRL